MQCFLQLVRNWCPTVHNSRTGFQCHCLLLKGLLWQQKPNKTVEYCFELCRGYQVSGYLKSNTVIPPPPYCLWALKFKFALIKAERKYSADWFVLYSHIPPTFANTITIHYYYHYQILLWWFLLYCTNIHRPHIHDLCTYNIHTFPHKVGVVDNEIGVLERAAQVQWAPQMPKAVACVDFRGVVHCNHTWELNPC